MGKTVGRVIMIQGTASHAGKSTLVAALCRLCAQAGYRVAPFKAQNMSNNAAVTEDGREIGRAQAMQATAAGISVTVDMNPILLKPQSDCTSQIVVLGHPRRVAGAREYYDLKSELWPVVTGALDRLRAAYDVVVMEGAGSPAEINLVQYDIVNMRIARYADAPVLLVGDIDRGGVFASLYGTVALLQSEERALIRGFVINKFRGDPSLLDPGFEMLHERTGIPTLGVLPYLDLSRLPAEDAVEWGTARSQVHQTQESVEGSDIAVIDIAVIRLPRIANLDEFQPLACEPGVRVRFIANSMELGTPDLIIIPGTKSTLADLAWLRERGLDTAIQAQRETGVPILGICGGFQMLGVRLIDEHGAEMAGEAVGLGLLSIGTHFSADKITRRVTARIVGTTALWASRDTDTGTVFPQTLGEVALEVYEIHMGRSILAETDENTLEGTVDSDAEANTAPFMVSSPDGELVDGTCSADGLVIGTYLHGLFENAALRRAVLVRLAKRKGIRLPDRGDVLSIDAVLDTLAAAVREHIDLTAVADMIGLPRLADLGNTQ